MAAILIACLSPGIQLHFYANSAEKKCIVLSSNMAALSRGWKPIIGVSIGGGNF